MNNNIDRTLDVVFQGLGVFLYTITLKQKLKGVTCMLFRMSCYSTPKGITHSKSFWHLPQMYCERKIASVLF